MPLKFLTLKNSLLQRMGDEQKPQLLCVYLGLECLGDQQYVIIFIFYISIYI